MPTKQQLRIKYKNKRLALSFLQREMLEDLLLIQFQQVHIAIPTTVFTYAPYEKMREYNPELIIQYCQFKNPAIQIFYPVLDENNTGKMHCVLVDNHTNFAANKYGIAEPTHGYIAAATEIELVIVPLLAFDAKCNRIGYCKGYYDKFLAACAPNCIKIGCTYFDDVEIIEDINQFDIQLDFIITPYSIHQFNTPLLVNH